jgi:hypothetical protein
MREQMLITAEKQALQGESDDVLGHLFKILALQPC